MKLRRKITAAATASSLALFLLAGCGAAESPATSAPLAETGQLTLSVNPEIVITYNREGQVTALEGGNADGEQIVAAYPDYVGKECDVVLEGLIGEIHEAGYFVEDLDGNPKNIILQLEPGSVLQEDDFLEDMSLCARQTAEGLTLTSGVVTIDGDDYDPQYAQDGEPSSYITLEKAQEIALAQANVKAADAAFDDREFDLDDGTPIYELEFTAGGVEYEYDVDARTGKILKAEREALPTATTPAGESSPAAESTPAANDTDYGPNNDGVTDYNDTDYGPNNDGVTDYNDTDYGPNSDGVTDYGDSNYDDGGSNYDSGNSGYGDSNYDDGGSNYDADGEDGDSDYDD